MSLGSVGLLIAAALFALLFVASGAAAIVFGLALFLFGSASGVPVVVVGLITFAAGLVFAWRVAVPMWHLVKEDR